MPNFKVTLVPIILDSGETLFIEFNAAQSLTNEDFASEPFFPHSEATKFYIPYQISTWSNLRNNHYKMNEAMRHLINQELKLVESGISKIRQSSIKYILSKLEIEYTIVES